MSPLSCREPDPYRSQHRLWIFRLRDGVVEQLPPDRAFARPGDRLQVAVLDEREGYGALFSLDGDGAVTLHYPEGDMAAPITEGRMTLLDHSFELDASPSFEMYFWITAPQPFDLHSIKVAVERLAHHPAPEAALGLPANFTHTSFCVHKELSP